MRTDIIIIKDTTGITAKRRIQDEDHVRVGITQTALWIDGVRRFIRDNNKPANEFSISDCLDLLEELEHQRRMSESTVYETNRGTAESQTITEEQQAEIMRNFHRIKP